MAWKRTTEGRQKPRNDNMHRAQFEKIERRLAEKPVDCNRPSDE